MLGKGNFFPVKIFSLCYVKDWDCSKITDSVAVPQCSSQHTLFPLPAPSGKKKLNKD